MSSIQSWKTCLYFGTFNPIHNGHLMIAQATFNQFAGPLGLTSVTFIPAGTPPIRHGEENMLDARRRFRMVQLATASHPAFRVSDIEMHRPGKSYTAETIRFLLEQGLVQEPVPMIIGSDALSGLASWHQPEALVDSVRFLQVPRPGYPFIDAIPMPDGTLMKLNTCPVEIPLFALSSSWVRLQITTSQGYEAIRQFVPEPVRAYLANNHLYLPRPA